MIINLNPFYATIIYSLVFLFFCCIKQRANAVQIKVELIDRKLDGYCVDNEISICMRGDFEGNITESLIDEKMTIEQSISQFCRYEIN